MEAFGAGNNAKSQRDDFLSDLYRNDSYSNEATIAQPGKANTDRSPPPSGYSFFEDVIAILSSIPSSIIIYVSIHHDIFPNPACPIICIAAIAFGSTIALPFEAFRLLARSRCSVPDFPGIPTAIYEARLRGYDRASSKEPTSKVRKK
jgi:hypothetical protein